MRESEGRLKLIEEQNRAYEESLAKDRAKALQKERERAESLAKVRGEQLAQGEERALPPELDTFSGAQDAPRLSKEEMRAARVKALSENG